MFLFNKYIDTYIDTYMFSHLLIYLAAIRQNMGHWNLNILNSPMLATPLLFIWLLFHQKPCHATNNTTNIVILLFSKIMYLIQYTFL